MESAGPGGASTEAPRRRRSQRLLQARKRSHDASPPSPPPPSPPRSRRQAGKRSGAPPPPPPPRSRRQAGKRSGAPSPSKQDNEIVGYKIVGGGVDDAEAEYSGATLFHLTKEEMLSKYKRLCKKRANMVLAWYHTSNPEDRYEFVRMLLDDVCCFMDGGVCYMHMNFKARNVATGSEKLFFAELALINNAFDANGGYSTTACSIVDDNCLGGQKGFRGVRVERYDEKNCYACAKKIKHPTGRTYKGGHYVEDYFVGSSDSE